jgi:hypothetical protein
LDRHAEPVSDRMLEARLKDLPRGAPPANPCSLGKRARLLPPPPARCPPCRACRHLDQPCRLSLHLTVASQRSRTPRTLLLQLIDRDGCQKHAIASCRHPRIQP